MRTYILVALGCAFWLLLVAPLAFLALVHGTPENGYGFHYEGHGFNYTLVLLFAVPLLMVALTIFLGWLAKRGRLTEGRVVAANLFAVLVGFSWCATLVLIQSV